MSSIPVWLATFAHDDKLKIVLVLIAVDFILGVTAALKTNTFQLSYLANFAKDDLLGKVVPWFVLYSAALVAGHQTILGSVVDFGDLADVTFGIVTAAMAGSIYKSLTDLGFSLPLPPALNRSLK